MNQRLDHLIDKSDLIAWYRYDPATSTGGNLNDVVGSRHLVQETNPPALQPNAWRGQTAWYWNGGKNPLVYAGSVTPKQIFIVAALEESEFGTARTLLEDWLVTNDSGTAFDTPSSDFTYRKDVLFADNDWQAPTEGKPLLIEVTNADGVAMDGFSIGEDFKGYFFEMWVYSSVRPQVTREGLAEYCALKYKIWRKVADGKDVWPFQPDWSTPTEADKLVLASTSVSGSIKSRAKSLSKIGIEAGFTTRNADEWDAGYSFWDSKYPGTPFIYRDYSFETPRDFTVRFLSGFKKTRQASFHDIDYTWRVISENLDDIWDGGTVPIGALMFEDEFVLFSDE